MHRRLLLLPLAAVLTLGAACGSATPVAPDDSTVLRSGVFGGVSTDEDGGSGDDQQDRGGTYGGSST